MRSRLQPLPFGNDRASTYSSADEFAAALRLYRRPIADFSFTSPSRRGGASAVRIGGLSVSAAFSEPMHAKCMVDPQVSFILPLMGSGKIIGGSQFVEWMTGRLIISNSYDRPMEYITGVNAIITLRASPGTMLAALRRVLGERERAGAVRADDMLARLLVRGPFIDPGRAWSVDYHAAIMRLAELIDDCNCDEALLARIGFEDVATGLLAQLSLDQECGAQVAVEEGAQAASRSLKAVDLICDHIRSTIGSPLSIPQMEALTGLTGRALNYAFRARFGCSPQEWQRNFLLDHARLVLKDADYTGTVKGLAYELGFASPSSFAGFYRQRFGELPSETLARGVRPQSLHPVPE